MRGVLPGWKEPSDMTLSSSLRSVRWVWTLPILAVAVTASLMVLAVRQDGAFRAANPGVAYWEYQAPARLAAQVINGPGYFLPSPFAPVGYDWIRLPGVVLFWAWIGRGLDRKLRRTAPKISKSSFRRGISYVALLGLAVLFACEFFKLLRSGGMLPSGLLFQSLVCFGTWERSVRASEWRLYVGLLWTLVYAFYFGYKLLSTLREQPHSRDEAAHSALL